MVRQTRAEWKAGYYKKLSKQLADCEKCFIVNVDNVRSRQMQQIRTALRGHADVVMGKNTLMKKVISDMVDRDENLEKLIPHVRENVGFIFTKGDLCEIREKLETNRVEAPAKAGAIAPCDVMVSAQNTGLGPEKTSFFQALNIPTKIARGTVEILSDVHLIKKDTKVGASEATLLNMLKIYPFTYGMTISQVYDRGSVYESAVLDITTEIVLQKFMNGMQNIAALSLATGFTTLASVPQLMATGFKNLLALSVMTDYTFKEAEKIKEFIADPSKFQAAAPPASSAPPASAPKADAKAVAAAAPAPEPESESDSDMGMGIFD